MATLLGGERWLEDFDWYVKGTSDEDDDYFDSDDDYPRREDQVKYDITIQDD